jgi:ABC-type microcin C transport system permease subunit YejB
MWSYVLKRLLLMIPTLFGILLITFVIIQFVPGGPVEQMVAQIQGFESGGEGGAITQSGYLGRQGVDAARLEEIKKLYSSRASTWATASSTISAWASSCSRSCRCPSASGCGRSCSST